MFLKKRTMPISRNLWLISKLFLYIDDSKKTVQIYQAGYTNAFVIRHALSCYC
jgi:hypothetical protein